MQHVLLNEAFDAHAHLLEATRSALTEKIVEAIEVCSTTLRNGGKILLAGNGGSAADAQHLATEWVVRLKQDRMAMAAIALTTDTSTLTAAGNDYGFEHVFYRQIEAIGRPGDVFIALSTSGNSKNILKAARAAKRSGISVIALTGRGGGKLAETSDVLLSVPDDETARIQEMHILIGHVLCGGVEAAVLQSKTNKSTGLVE